MKTIVRNYVIVTSLVLCLTLLATGIIGVRQETSYVISGEKEEVIRVQSTTSQRLLVKENEESQEQLLTVDSADTESFFIFLSSVLPSPFSQIVWGMNGDEL